MNPEDIPEFDPNNEMNSTLYVKLKHKNSEQSGHNEFIKNPPPPVFQRFQSVPNQDKQLINPLLGPLSSPQTIPANFPIKPTQQVPPQLIPVNQRPAQVPLNQAPKIIPKINSGVSLPVMPTLNPTLLPTLNPKHQIEKQQPISIINFSSRVADFSEIIFVNDHLLSLQDIFATPVLCNPEVNGSTYEPFLKKILPKVNFESQGIHTSMVLNVLKDKANLISAVKNNLFCSCGGQASATLLCTHSICNMCLKTSSTCRVCEEPFDTYKKPGNSYKCLSCKTQKSQSFTCPHYCLSCIKRKLLFKNQYICAICCSVSNKSIFDQISQNCVNCAHTIKEFYEICDKCYYCKECFLKCLAQKQCLNCKTKLSLRAHSKLKQHLMSTCEVCIKLKDSSQITLQSDCCNSKLCKSCSGIPCKICSPS